MSKITKIIAVVTGILTILDIALRNIDYANNLKFLIEPLFAVNILEIAILFLFVSIAYNFLPKKLSRLFLHQRAKKFYKNWKEFKKILIEYQETKNIELQKSYEDVREKLEEDFNFFAPSIHSIQNATHRQHNKLAINNFEHCFTVREIAEWQDKVRRQIPMELDCFDYLLISLKEDFKKPERPYTSTNKV